ncbi:hypothetical protein GCM10017771_53220 [Streptomyces capitiformicae]|uniref:Uncharacterized protein n=1 Tax=Streptomyces capitiformicae TaxID=2014920 RepID=A0A918Z5Q5_9ACTN|nr:hypothetical protein GCM10017771_53220 [Streptomyces capitiformicae]
MRNVASAVARRRSISSSPRASYVLSVSPFAGFTVAMGMADLLRGLSFDLPARQHTPQRGQGVLMDLRDATEIHQEP